jgi:putative addiction module component (TIGR02574 family)
MKPDIDISQLSPAECVLLAEQLWERASNHPDAIPVPPEHLEELQRRVEALDSGTMEPGEPWEVVRARLWPR